MLGGRALRRARRGARARGPGAAQPRLAPAHLGGGRGRHGDPRLGRRDGNLATEVAALELVTLRRRAGARARAATRTSTASSSGSARSGPSRASRSTSSRPTRCASACSRGCPGTPCSSTSTPSPRARTASACSTASRRGRRAGLDQEPRHRRGRGRPRRALRRARRHRGAPPDPRHRPGQLHAAAGASRPLV